MRATALETQDSESSNARRTHTVWGLDAVELHARFWASRGVQVVRRGEPSPLVHHAELYLLLDVPTLACFPLREIAQEMAWIDADLAFVRVQRSADETYREQVVTDEEGRFVRFRRVYAGDGARLACVTVTPDQRLAALWQASTSGSEGRRLLRRAVPRGRRWSCSVEGETFDRSCAECRERFVRRLVEAWTRPDATVDGLRPSCKGVWAHESAEIGTGAKFVGRVWIGAGRAVGPDDVVVGPGVLWDDGDARPEPVAIRWLDLEPTRTPGEARARRRPPLERAVKRAFDVAFALLAILLTLPLYPAIMLAILIEDGRPLFFAHRRETLRGREFPCLKFRSMRKDAEHVKAELAAANQADGPQFFMDRDPRLTRTGSVIRKLQLDELPQFFNVLVGHMSIVGPRPSPHRENQYCPGWREARLSVRPGITGLWQIKRTRAPGTDFQEWIRYDIEYVENAGFWLDLMIIYKTLAMLVRGVLRS